MQDAKGFLWFGTEKGLDRYDGYSIRNYRPQRARAGSIANELILSLYSGRDGVLWAGTNVGLSRYDRAHDSFENYRIGAAARQVRCIVEDARGILWVGTNSGLFRIERTTGAVVPVEGDVDVLFGDLAIQALTEDRTGRLWVGTETHGLIVLDRARRVVQRHAHRTDDARSLPDNDVRSIVEGPHGSIWVGTWSGGLAKIEPASGRITRYGHASSDPRTLGANRIVQVAPAGRRGLWIGLEDAGLEFFDFASKTFTHHRSDPTNASSLSSGSVWAVHEDRTGTVWVGTFTGGVNVALPNAAAIRHYRSVAGNPASLSMNTVRAFADSRPGSYWVATDGGGLNELDEATGRFVHYTSHNSNLNSDAVLDVVRDHEGVTWISTWGGGISRFDRATKSFTAYTMANSTLGDNNVFALHVDRRGDLWVGTRTQGVYVFDRRRRTFVQKVRVAQLVGGLSNTVPSAAVRIIRESPDGAHILIGTERVGLADYEVATGTVTLHQSVPTDSATLSHNTVHAVTETPDGVIWVGTGAGLDRIDRRTERISHFGEHDGLPSNHIAGLTFDRAGNLWIGSDRGIARLDTATLAVKRFTVAVGVQASEFNPHATYLAIDGSLFFGGSNGFNVVRVDRLALNRHAPTVVLTGLQLFNREVLIGVAGSPLTRHISETRELILTYRQSAPTFAFAALDYTNPEQNAYAYMMEGLDQGWQHVGAQRSASYTNLPPGHYTFRVKGSNSVGVWNESGTSIRVVVTPPVWATWWFRALVLLVVAAALVAIIRSAQQRHRTLRVMNEQLGRAAEHDRDSQRYLEGNVLDILGAMQKFSGGDYSVALAVESEDAIGKLRLGFNSVVADRKRAEEELRQSQKMEAVGRLAGGVAHDFNNLLTVIKGNAELALADLEGNEVVREELVEIERASERASSLTRQLLAFSRKQILKPQTLLVNELVVDLSRMLRRTLGEDVTLTIALEPVLGAVRADPGQIEQVLLNLIVNARDAMPRGGELRIETRNVDAATAAQWAEAEADVSYVAMLVSDNGTGMTVDVQERLFEPFFTTKEQGKGTALGLSTVYGSVKQSGGFVLVESALGVGSTFGVYLPRVKALVESSSIEEIEHAPSAERLMPLHPGMRLLYASGYTEDAIIRHGVSSLETAFLEKPFTPTALLRKVRRVLDDPAATTLQLAER